MGFILCFQQSLCHSLFLTVRLWSMRGPSPNPLCCNRLRRTRPSAPEASLRAWICPSYPDLRSSKGGTRRKSGLLHSSENDAGEANASFHTFWCTECRPRLISSWLLNKGNVVKHWTLFCEAFLISFPRAFKSKPANHLSNHPISVFFLVTMIKSEQQALQVPTPSMRTAVSTCYSN